MPRNESFTLSPSQAGKVGAYSRILADKVGQRVEMSFTKRDGSARTVVGTVDKVVPNGSHGTVGILTDNEGYKSANLWNVTKVIVL